MCAVSMVSDHYQQKFDPQRFQDSPLGLRPGSMSGGGGTLQLVSKAEFDELKKDVLEMKALLKRAREYDERTGQPDCHMDEKVAALKKIAELVGVSLEDVFGKGENK